MHTSTRKNTFTLVTLQSFSFSGMIPVEKTYHSADQEGCYPQRLKAEVDNTLQDLQNSSYPTKAEFNKCFIIHSKYFPVLKGFSQFRSAFPVTKYNTTLSPGFLCQQFNNLQRAALLMSF